MKNNLGRNEGRSGKDVRRNEWQWTITKEGLRYCEDGKVKASKRKFRTGTKAAAQANSFTIWREYVNLHCHRVAFVGCLTSQQQASVSQGRICSDNFACCHTEIEVADQTFYLTQSQYTDTGPTSPSADPITPGAW